MNSLNAVLAAIGVFIGSLTPILAALTSVYKALVAPRFYVFLCYDPAFKPPVDATILPASRHISHLKLLNLARHNPVFVFASSRDEWWVNRADWYVVKGASDDITRSIVSSANVQTITKLCESNTTL